MSAKRKQKFSIVTNEMSDAVYDRLLKMVNKRSLTPYIIELVQRDIEGEKTQLDMRNLYDEIRRVSDKIDQLQVVQPAENDSEGSVVAEFTEGDIAKGEIEEDVDLDF